MKVQVQTEVSRQKLVKFLKKTVKRSIAQQGINPATRKGNKELEILLRKIAKEPWENQEQVKAVGEKLAETIGEISQKQGKVDLDRGVIRQLAIQNKNPLFKEVTNPADATTVLEKEVLPLKTPSSPPSEDTRLMSLKERVAEDIKTAMKAKDKILLETVRSIKKALLEKEIALRPSGKDSLTPEQEIELLSQSAKQRRESIEQYQAAGRDDLADREAQELAIIETYLPKQLSEEELSAILDGILATVGATSAKDLGKVMGVAMQQLKGKADGKKIQALVKDKLEQSS